MSGKFKVPGTFTVPDTIEGVVGLLKARGWEKSAIVYAYTKKPAVGRPEKLGEIPQITTGDTITFPCSYSEFASLGINGLQERHDVAWYRQQWVEWIAIAGEDAMVGPGDTIDVPGHKFPVHPRSYKPSQNAIDTAIAAKTVEEKAQLARTLLDEPAVEEEVYRDPELVDRAVTTDARHTARNRTITDPHIGAQERQTEPEPTYHRDDQGHQFLNALSNITSASMNLTGVAEELAGVKLTKTQCKQLDDRFDRLAGKLDMLRSSISTGSVDDELAAILAAGE